MLLANLAKSDDIRRILTLTRGAPKPLSSSSNTIDQLMDCFVRGASGAYNKAADYDYLAYFFADIAKVRLAGILWYPYSQTRVMIYTNSSRSSKKVRPISPPPKPTIT